ncbi:MAG: oxidoreductase [Parvibaculaceae bacterium]|nr:oxidoreductase [Parvibaculaceae bacterium]
MSGRTALVAGATGLIGGHLVTLLLTDPAYEKVVVLARRPLAGASSPKLQTIIADFDALDAALSGIAVDDAFCALGTTIKVAGSQDAFRRVDHDYIVSFARTAKAAGAVRFLLVSAMGADANSSIFYSRVKGETERDVRALGFEALHVFRPGLLLGDRTEKRIGEEIGATLTPFLNPLMIGPLRAYRSIRGETVARAMKGAALAGAAGTHIHTYEAMERFAGV